MQQQMQLVREMTYIHSGGHLFLDDVPLVIVKFFKQYAKT
jgi:hypothetical protein